MFHKEVRKESVERMSVASPATRIDMNQAIMRGRRLQALYIRDSFAKLGQAVSRWLETYKTRAMLNSMTDRELSDMGLSRGDIDAVAFGYKAVDRKAAADMTAEVGGIAGKNIAQAA